MHGLCCRPANERVSPTRSPSSFSFFLIKTSLQSNILMADSTPSTKVCRNCKQEKPADQFISKTRSSLTCGRLTANCLDCRNRQSSRASKRTAEQAELSPIRREGLPLINLQLRTPILPKESEVADTEWRKHAEAIARSLPRRPLRGGLRSNRARKSHDTANSGGSAQHQPTGQPENGELRGTGGVSGPGPSAWQPSLLKEHGAPEAANSDPPLFHRHFLPRERGPEDDEQGDTAAVSGTSLLRRNPASTPRPIEPKQLALDDTRGSDQAAAAIVRGLPKRRRRGGRPPKRRPGTSGASNTGGSGQHPACTRVQHGGVAVDVDDAAAEPADASLSGQSLPPRVVGGSPRAAAAEPVPFHRHGLPKESHREDGYEGAAAAVVPEERRGARPITRSRPRSEDVGPCPARAIWPKEMEDTAGDARLTEWSLPRPLRRAASGEADQPRRGEVMEPTLLGRRRKRIRYSRRDQPPVKRIRTGIRRQRRRELQAEDLASVLRSLEEEFAVKESLSNKQTWCAPIPH